MMNMNMNMQNNAKQQGVAMVITLVVLLAMTVIGLTATDSSNLQALLAKNSQFRMEVFNASNTELNAQLDYYRSQTNFNTSPAITTLLNQPIGTTLVEGQEAAPGTGALIIERAVNPGFNKEISLSIAGGCSLQTPDATKQCVLFRIESSAQLPDTNIKSEQVQTFKLSVLKQTPNLDSTNL